MHNKKLRRKACLNSSSLNRSSLVYYMCHAMDVMTNAHRKVILNMSRAERQLADQTVKAEIM
jgi:hypothetical protein